jgi:hypothetical protein
MPRSESSAPKSDMFFGHVLITGLVRIGLNRPQDGNRTVLYGHVAVVYGHVWRTVCSVCATGARVARPVPCNS